MRQFILGNHKKDAFQLEYAGHRLSQKDYGVDLIWSQEFGEKSLRVFFTATYLQ